MMQHSLVPQQQMSHLYLFVLFVTTTFVVAFFSSPTSAFTAPQVVVRSSVRSGPASVVASASVSSSASTALYGKREKIKKKLKQMLGRRADEAVEDDAVLLSPDVDALSNFLVDGTYSGKKRNIIKKQLKKMVKSQSQSKEEEEKKQAAETVDANTLHALSSLASLEQDIETLYVPISVVVDGVLSQKIDEMDQKTTKSGGGGAKKEIETDTPPPRQKINLNDMYRLIAEQKGNTVTYADTETETDIEKTATPKSSSSASASASASASSSFTSSTSPPEKKIVQNVLSKLTSKKSMDVTTTNDDDTNHATTNKMVKLSTNEKELEKLSQKYKEIDDVGERTYQMLLDLGMIGK